MSRIKLKQILSNLHYDAINDQLILSGSKIPAGLQNWEEVEENWEETLGSWEGDRSNIPDFVIYGSTFVTSSAYATGSVTIDGIDTFGDSGSFYTADLGDY